MSLKAEAIDSRQSAGISKATCAVDIRDRGPPPAAHGEQNAAACDSAHDCLAEVAVPGLIPATAMKTASLSKAHVKSSKMRQPHPPNHSPVADEISDCDSARLLHSKLCLA